VPRRFVHTKQRELWMHLCEQLSWHVP
jgi:hypothetical protein